MERPNYHHSAASLPVGLGEALDNWRDADGPLHRRLATALGMAVERGAVLPGTKLPPERLLAAQLGLGRATVSAAYQTLDRRRLVERRQGRGTHVVGRDGLGVDLRAADLTTALQRNMIFRRYTERREDAIDLLGGAGPPSPRVTEALVSAAAAVDVAELVHRDGYVPLGLPKLRRAIARYLTAGGLATAEEEILVTGGAQQAISLLAAYQLHPGAPVVLEDPTFPGAVDAFRSVGARILTVPVGNADLVAEHISETPVRAVYLVPSFHNPTGSVMSEDTRRELARLAGPEGLLLIEDNTLAELALAGTPPRPIAAYRLHGPIVSIGSLSKLFWSGLRVGWIRSSRSMIAQLGQLKAVADLGTSLFSQAIAANLVDDLQSIRELRRRELAAALDHAEALLRRRLPDWSWRRPTGGPSLWARLPFGSASEFAQVAARFGVLVAPGPVMSASGRFDDHVRLLYDSDAPMLEEGIRRLALAWEAYRATVESDGSSRLELIV